MQAALIAIGKWLITAIIVPMVEKAVAAYLKSREKINRYKANKQDAKDKAEAYEKNPTDSNRNDLP
jgi:hypothetical protein